MREHLEHKLSPEEIMPILSKIAIFGGIDEKQLSEITGMLKVVSYDQDEFVYSQGDDSSYIYIIRSGKVKMVIDAGEEYLELITFGPGDCFGETSVMGIQAHSVSALTVEPTELVILERGDLLNIFETDKELFGILILNIARETSRRLYKSDRALAEYILEEERRSK